MPSKLAAALVIAALGVGCGVGTYRAGRVTGAMQMRFVAAEGAPGEEVARWFSDERLTLEADAFVEASHVREVHLEDRPDGARHIVLYLDELGARRLAEATRENEGRRLAIVVEGRVVAAPTIRTPITEGVAHVTVEGDIEQVFEALTRARD